MRIVLLGATGFVGRHLLPRLSAAGHDCLALTRNRMSCRDLSIIPRVQVRVADAHDRERLAEMLLGADAVVSMVGILNESGRRGKGFHKAHVALVEGIIEGCRAAGVDRLVHVSALNAGRGKSLYLSSKGEAEESIRSATDLNSTILQPSVIFGAGDSFFNRFAGLLKAAPVLPLACPDARLQPVWVGDVATLLTAVVADSSTAGQSLILVGPREYSLRELVEFTARTVGSKARIIGLPDFLSRLQGRLMDFVPGKPFSSDNYLSLQTDNTSAENSLLRFGIKPRSIESTVPDYLGPSSRQRHLDDCRRHVQH
jgi:uncharacterized protein YbjT (DUF2867 family)